VSAELFALVPEYVLGTLPEVDARQLEAELATSPALARELDEALAGFAQLAEALPPLAPDPAVRARLLRTLEGADRFAPFLARIAGLVDLTIDAVRDLVARIDDPAAWEPGLPGMHLQHFQAGPRFATADAGFVRLQPGMAFPRHRHLGPELTVVLEGGMRSGDRVYGPGDVLELPEGSVHDYAASSERDLLILTVHTGIVPVFDEA
jgi:putative transcriptional regulator